MIAVLSKTTAFRRHSFFEERSAAFFALGIARRTGRPAVVITTSGTAAAELLPAVIEAFHTGVPLIVVTADRPRRLRGTGAPQAIDQTGLFTKFIAAEYDLEAGELFDLSGWDRRRPIHLNVCFDEPLIDEPLTESSVLSGANDTGAGDSLENSSESFAGRLASGAAKDASGANRLEKFLASPGALVVVVGTLETRAERAAVSRFLTRLRAPVYLESTSGLRESGEESGAIGLDLSQLALRSGDRVLSWALARGHFQKVLRIGGIPTVRIWRDLDDPNGSVRTMSLTPLPFAGLSRGEMVCGEIERTLEGVTFAPQTREIGLETLLAKDREAASELTKLLDSEPRSEPSLVRSLSRLIPVGSCVYVGNSLPIREWDLAADFDRPFAVEANRGVNGIDGQVSTFLGLAREGAESWALIGDLTALYDLPGPWALQCREDVCVRLVVMNNGGGKIFHRLFRDPLFENRHSLSFEPWAQLWGLAYEKWNQIPAAAPEARASIIEIVPDEAATQTFWDRYEKLWK